MPSSTIAALFVERRSVYATIPQVERWDAERDARTYAGPWPVVAHPPCASWGRLAHLSKPGPGLDGGCAASAIAAVRRFGGVLEHPAWSGIFHRFMLPFPGYFDHLGGWTIAVDQLAFGHRALKPTWLYIVGAQVVPPIPQVEEIPTMPVRNMGHRERVRTPPAFARFLVEIARSAAS